METESRTVLIAGTHSPTRAVALELTLRDCLERNGWGERFDLAVVGVGSGAGSVPQADLRTLREAGLGEPRSSCPDLDQSQDLLRGVLALVTEDEATTAALIRYRELGRADLVRLDEAFPEFAKEYTGDLANTLEGFVEAAPELLRRVLAGAAAEFAVEI